MRIVIALAVSFVFLGCSDPHQERVNHVNGKLDHTKTGNLNAQEARKQIVVEDANFLVTDSTSSNKKHVSTSIKYNNASNEDKIFQLALEVATAADAQVDGTGWDAAIKYLNNPTNVKALWKEHGYTLRETNNVLKVLIKFRGDQVKDRSGIRLTTRKYTDDPIKGKYNFAYASCSYAETEDIRLNRFKDLTKKLAWCSRSHGLVSSGTEDSKYSISCSYGTTPEPDGTFLHSLTLYIDEKQEEELNMIWVGDVSVNGKSDDISIYFTTFISKMFEDFPESQSL